MPRYYADLLHVLESDTRPDYEKFKRIYERLDNKGVAWSTAHLPSFDEVLMHDLQEERNMLHEERIQEMRRNPDFGRLV